MATDLDVAGVGSSAQDSDFIVPRALQGWDSVRRSPQTPQAPGSDEAVPMSQGWQPLPCPRHSLSLWASLPGAVPRALFKRAEVFLSAVLPTFLCSACSIDNLPCGGKLNIFALQKAVGVVCLAQGACLACCL